MIQKVSFRSMNNGVESRNKVMVYDFSKKEMGITQLLVNAAAHESLRGNRVVFLSMEIHEAALRKRFNDANSNVENIQIIESTMSVAVKATHEIYNGEMIPYLFELYKGIDNASDGKSNILVIDCADFLVGTDIINKLIHFADKENINIYTAIRNKSRLPNVWED
jgi:Mrp family chromosome partitioning ATPase